MSAKKQADLIVMCVMFISGLVAIISGILPDLRELFTGASILFSASLITRAMQWAADAKDE